MKQNQSVTESPRTSFLGITNTTLIFLLTLVCIELAAYIAVSSCFDSFPRGKDGIFHLTHLESFQYYLHSIGWARLPYDLQEVYFNREIQYPPIPYLLAIFFRGLFPFLNSFVSVMVSRIVFVPVFVFGFYFLCRATMDRGWSLLATLIAANSGAVFSSSTEFSPTFPMLALTVASVALLLRSHAFERTLDTFLLGILFGIGMMTYYGYGLYVGPAFLYVMLRRFHQRQWSIAVWLPQILVFGSVVLILMAPYYVSSVLAVLSNEMTRLTDVSASNITSPDSESIGRLTWVWLGKYLFIFLQGKKGIVFTIGVIVLGRKAYRPGEYWNSLALTALVSLGFFSLFVGKHQDYIIPLTPLFFVFLVAGIAAFPKKLGVLAAAVLIVLQIQPVQKAYNKIDPTFSYAEVQSVFQPVVEQCPIGVNSCSIEWACNPAPCIDYFLVRDTGFDPRRKWIRPPASGRFNAKEVDFVLVYTMDLWGFQYKGARTDGPGEIGRQFFFKYDIETNQSRLLLNGEDVTDQFVLRGELISYQFSVMSFENRDRMR